MEYAVVMAGGAGTRLWPMSRGATPKQLLKLAHGQSLLGHTLARAQGLVAPERLMICTGAGFVGPITQDMPGLHAGQFLPEPEGRDTLNAVAYSAAVLARQDPEAVLAVLTADHIITPEAKFREIVRQAFHFVAEHPDELVTFGIKPTHAATGFGYLQRGAALAEGVWRAGAFKEKPVAAVAESYLAQGGYSWNSGMFVWRAETLLEQVRVQAPVNYAGVMEIAAAWGTAQQEAVLQRVYPTLPKVSVDFGIMEHAPRVAMLEMDLAWLDLGAWTSVAELLTPEAAGNRVLGACAVTVDSAENLIISETPHVVATLGLRRMLIVHTPESTLVCPLDRVEEIKQVVAAVRARAGARYV
ncbi:MAG: mannose-1-phosphate guanylyltransferase [Phycisphaerae bacterium]